MQKHTKNYPITLPPFHGQISEQGASQRRIGIPKEIWAAIDDHDLMKYKNLELEITIKVIVP